MKKALTCRCGKGFRFVKKAKKVKKNTRNKKQGRGMYLRPYKNFT